MSRGVGLLSVAVTALAMRSFSRLGFVGAARLGRSSAPVARGAVPPDAFGGVTGASPHGLASFAAAMLAVVGVSTAAKPARAEGPKERRYSLADQVARFQRAKDEKNEPRGSAFGSSGARRSLEFGDSRRFLNIDSVYDGAWLKGPCLRPPYS